MTTHRYVHGTRSCYVKNGCRRPECKEAESAYQRDRRRRKQPQRPAAVSPLNREVGGDAPNGRSFEPAEIGRVEAGVLEEIEGLTTAATRPGLVQGTLAMARLLDSPLNTAQHPQAMARLQAALDKLRKGADSRKSWLADVRKLTPRDGRGNPPA